MSTDATLSRRPPRRFWGWGQADARLDARELATVKAMVEHLDVPFAAPARASAALACRTARRTTA